MIWAHKSRMRRYDKFPTYANLFASKRCFGRSDLSSDAKIQVRPLPYSTSSFLVTTPWVVSTRKR